MTRPPDNTQVEAVFAILQNHCPAAAGNRLVARRIVTAVEHAASQDAAEPAAAGQPTVALLVQLPSTRMVAVMFSDASEAARWATEQGVYPMLRPPIVSKEEVAAELWRGGQ